MMKYTFKRMPGIEKIYAEIDTCKLYNTDHRGNRGAIEQTIDKLHPKYIDYTVIAIRQETDTAKTLRLSPLNGYLPPFVPGQYIAIEAEIDGIKTARPYSLSSPCTERGIYEITVRRTEGGFVSDWLLDTVQIGDKLRSSGPTGSFVQFTPVHGKRLVFIAGGSGITPFMSMIESDRYKLITDKTIDLIYGCAKESDIIFRDRLEKMEAAGFVRVHPIISEPETGCKFRTGLITADLIRDIISDIPKCTFFLCGPTAMYDFVLPELQKLEIPRRRIRKEVQNLPSDPTALPGWPENVKATDTFTISCCGKAFEACAGENILTAMERHGIVQPSRCRAGECSACRTKLLGGTVFHPENELLRRSDMKMGYIHPCATYPISDIELLL